MAYGRLATVGLLFFVSGCVDLQAVNTASGQLVSASSSWDGVADEFEASCHRRNQVSDIPSGCAAEKQATISLESADKILSAYFTALQQVSNGSNFSIDPGIAALQTSVQSIPGTNANQVQAVSGFAQFLANTATLTIRERTLKKLINDGAPKAGDTIDVLNNVVVAQLSNVFDREVSQTLATFSSYINQSGVAADLRTVSCADGPVTQGFSTGNAFLLAEAYCLRILAVSQKRAALVSYQSSLVTAKKALQDLQDGKDSLGAVAIIQQLVSEASSLKDDVAKINKAF